MWGHGPLQWVGYLSSHCAATALIPVKPPVTIPVPKNCPDMSPGRRTRLAPADDDNLRDALEGVLSDSLALSRLKDDQRQMAMALDGLGGLALACGDLEAARARHEEAARLFTELGDVSGAGIA